MNYLVVERASNQSTGMYMLEDLSFKQDPAQDGKSVDWQPIFLGRDMNGTISTLEPQTLLKNADAHLWFFTKDTNGYDLIFAQVQGCEIDFDERMCTEESPDAKSLETVARNADIREFIDALMELDTTNRIHVNEPISTSEEEDK